MTLRDKCAHLQFGQFGAGPWPVQGDRWGVSGAFVHQRGTACYGGEQQHTLAPVPTDVGSSGSGEHARGGRLEPGGDIEIEPVRPLYSDVGQLGYPETQRGDRSPVR